ncbi:MAG TPA: NtaA/DmoA family FMN-dependent monooxygenase [Acidimicrobiales bacterium]|nr:NtaA/DmoA family FMN-dependent monooxygenase [Acidimicrobiales bacterium]
MTHFSARDPDRQLHFGLMFWATGTHPAGWRYPGSRADGAYDIEFIQENTKVVERAKFDFLFLGDRLATDPALAATNPAQMSRLEPFVAGSAIAAATTHIGICVTANPTYYDPYTLARLFASLDHLSKGRASWNLVTGADAIAAANFSRDEHWDTEKRYDWADEFVDAVRELWDSWEDDAFTRDREAGRFVDETKVHSINHHGKFFDIAGPLNVARPPQGQVILLHAGTSDRSRELGAREADVIFAAGPNIETAKEYYADIKTRAEAYGRGPHEIQILPGLQVTVGETTAEANAIRDRLEELRPKVVQQVTGQKARAGALGQQSAGASRPASPRGLVGNPIEVADHIEHWFVEEACDGFNVFPNFVPGSVDAFAELVIPELQRRGLFRKEYTGSTFRDHLNLPKPPNRFDRNRSDPNGPDPNRFKPEPV